MKTEMETETYQTVRSDLYYMMEGSEDKFGGFVSKTEARQLLETYFQDAYEVYGDSEELYKFFETQAYMVPGVKVEEK